METPMPGGATTHDHMHKQATLAFQEYQFVAEDTAKITDRRQTVNTLFVSINAIFLTGVGYLLYLYFQTIEGDVRIFFFSLGFLAIAIITTRINHAWLRLSEQSRKLINLRIRYLERLENFLRDTGYFPVVDTPLKGEPADKNTEKEYEAPPATFPGSEFAYPDQAKVKQRWMRTRGTYSLEEVLYNNPSPKQQPFSFSEAEQRVGHTFTVAYWIAFGASVIAIAVQFVVFYTSFHFSVGPFKF